MQQVCASYNSNENKFIADVSFIHILRFRYLNLYTLQSYEGIKMMTL